MVMSLRQELSSRTKTVFLNICSATVGSASCCCLIPVDYPLKYSHECLIFVFTGHSTTLILTAVTLQM